MSDPINADEVAALRAEVERLRTELAKATAQAEANERLASQFLARLQPFDMSKFDPSLFVPGRDDTESFRQLVEECEAKVRHDAR